MLMCTSLLSAAPPSQPPVPFDPEASTPAVTQLQQSGVIGDFQVTVTDQQQEPPLQSGGIETTISLSIKYVGPVYGNPGTSLEFFAVGSKQLVYDLASFACEDAANDFDWRLFTNGSVSGTVCFVVHPDDADVLSLGVSEINGGNETLWLATTEQSVAITTPVAKPVSVSMHDDFSFAPQSIRIPANVDVPISVTNEGFAQHDFQIVGTDYATELLNNSQTETLTVNLPPGTYDVICSVPGHAESGMVATLTVESQDAVSTPAASGSAEQDVIVGVTMNDAFEFDPGILTIPANTNVTLRISNEGFLQHGFQIVGTAYATEEFHNGKSVDLVVNLPPGTYTFICPVPGHESLGMTGTLIVE